MVEHTASTDHTFDRFDVYLDDPPPDESDYPCRLLIAVVAFLAGATALSYAALACFG